VTAARCRAPASCPVPGPASSDLRRLRTYPLAAGSEFFASFRSSYGPSFNASGEGDARFSPFRDTSGGIVPTLYGGKSRTVALLETVFHDIHESYPRLVTRKSLVDRGLARLVTPERYVLVDLRDDALVDLGLDRRQLVSTTPAHYPCTQQWAEAIHGRRVGSARPVGLIWGSRIAELARADTPLLNDLLQGDRGEAFVFFGDLVGTVAPEHYRPHIEEFDLSAPGSRGLMTLVAEQLGAVLP
jgi:RES domain